MKTKFKFFPEKKLITAEFEAENMDDKHFLTILREKIGYRKFNSEIRSSTLIEGECRKMGLVFEASSKK